MAGKPSKTSETAGREPLRTSTLAQMWLGGVKGKLHPAEEMLLDACRRGQECTIGEVRPEKATKENLIRAGFLRYLILGGCEAAPVHARSVKLGGAFVDCDAENVEQSELDLEAIIIPRDISLTNCKIDGGVNLRDASCRSVDFNGSEIVRISASRISVKGSVILSDGLYAHGEVCFTGCEIDGQLCCDNGHFGGGLIGQGSVIGNNVLLRSTATNGDDKFVAYGTVNFANATIGGNIHCDKGHFLCKDQAFFANRAYIKGDVSFEDALIVGTVALTGSGIGGSLAFNRTRLNGKPSLQLRGSKIAGTLYWRDLKAVDGDVDLGGASCNTISFDPRSWMRKFEGQVSENNIKAENEDTPPTKRPSTKIDNFTYNGINNPPDKADGKFWIEWLKVQPEDHLEKKFRPKPWTHLAGVLVSMGYEGEAKKVLVEREWMLTRFMARHDPEDSTAGFISFNWARVMWRRIWGVTIDYGYQPLKALFFLTAVIFIGFGVYYWASLQGIMAPTHPLVFKEARLNGEGGKGTIDKYCAQNWVWLDKNCARQVPSEYSEFASFFYSADVALPIINLRQQEDWSPRVVDHEGVRIWSGYFVRMWEWFATVIGWALSLMFVSAVGGFIRR